MTQVSRLAQLSGRAQLNRAAAECCAGAHALPCGFSIAACFSPWDATASVLSGLLCGFSSLQRAPSLMSFASRQACAGKPRKSLSNSSDIRQSPPIPSNSASSFWQKMRPPKLIGGASISSAPQGSINVDRAAGYNLGTGANRAHDDEITFLKANYLPGPDRPVDQHNRCVPSDRFPVNAQFTLGDRRSCLKLRDQPDELGPRQSL